MSEVSSAVARETQREVGRRRSDQDERPMAGDAEEEFDGVVATDVTPPLRPLTPIESSAAPLAAAYGGGGLFGIAYLLGVGEALVDGGVDLGAAPAIGTSAGSWAAGALALGIRWHEAIDAIGGDIPRLPDPRSGRLKKVAAEIFGDRRAPTIRAVVCSLPRLQRVVLSGADHAVADLVAASSAVPGVLAPHRVAGRRYIDGGVRSMASADLADPAGHLLVMAPIAGPMFGPAGRLAERVLRREMREWRERNPGGNLWIIRPNRAIAELAGRPDQLFDPDRARRAYDLAYAQASGILSRWGDEYGDQPAAPSDEQSQSDRQRRIA